MDLSCDIRRRSWVRLLLKGGLAIVIALIALFLLFVPLLLRDWLLLGAAFAVAVLIVIALVTDPLPEQAPDK